MFRPEALWTAALLTTGLVGAVIYNWPRQAVVEPAAKDITEPTMRRESDQPRRGLSLIEKQTSAKPNTALIQLDALQLGDRLLLGGNFIGGYQQYSKLLKHTGIAADDTLLIRLGLAAELAGFLEPAEQHYRSAIQGPNASTLGRLWGLIGIARVWEIQGRLDQAITLLSELYLIYETDEYPSEVRLTVNQRLADCMQKRRLNTSPGIAISLPVAIEYFWCETKIEPILASMDGYPEMDAQAVAAPAMEVIQRPLDDVALILVDAELTSHPVGQLIRELASGTGLAIELSPRARSVVAGRSIRIGCSALPVSVLLDHALGPLDLTWSQDQRGVFVWHVADLTPQQKAEFETDRIQRMLRQLQVNFENGVERIAALMHDANISLLNLNYENAAIKYDAAREVGPAGELSAMLSFNRSVMQLAQQRREQALSGFYQALDQTLLPRLQGSCYAMIAELELELGRPGKAVPAAARGLRLSGGTAHAARNLMTLAKSYLLESDPYSANRILFKHASSLPDARNQRLAGVIAAYARFQAARPLSGLQNEGERLVLSLAALRPDDPENFIDHLLIARAFNDVGFRSKAIEHLTLASEAVSDGYWHRRMRLELAEMLYLDAELEKADQTLASIPRDSADAISINARLLEAKVKFQLDRTTECEAICQSLLRLPLDEQTKRQTLELLGEVYQATGKHYSAALCFAGLLPETVTAADAEPADTLKP